MTRDWLLSNPWVWLAVMYVAGSILIPLTYYIQQGEIRFRKDWLPLLLLGLLYWIVPFLALLGLFCWCVNWALDLLLRRSPTTDYDDVIYPEGTS